MAEKQLRDRIKEARDHIGLFTLLGAALGLGLKRYGVDWPMVSAIVSASVVVFVFLVWVRPRIFRSWRLLELCLHAGKRFAGTRALVDAVRCALWARHYELPTYVVARLRVEAELLTGGKDRGKTAEGERGWREHFRAMLADDHRLARADGWIGAAADLPGYPFRTQIPDCLPLTAKDAFAGIDRYFKALTSLGSVDDRFLSELRVKSAYVAPLYLLTGQLAHFDDNWREVVEAYSNVTSVDDPIADEALRYLRAFQFACWIVWGPSIPVCTCEYWDHEHKNAVGFQLGYGDENTSVILYDESGVLRHATRRARRRAAGGKGAGRPAIPPLAVELEATVIVCRPGSADRRRVCQAQTQLLDVGAERVILQHRRLDATGRAGRRYYSAYLWVMFVLEAGPGRPLMRAGEAWRALLPFFVHGNIADASTYAFLKDRLAHEALDSIAAALREPGIPPHVRFVYMAAIDDPGCGGRPLASDPGAQIKRTLQQLLAERFVAIADRVSVRDDSSELKAEDGSYYAEFFSACHLPETIGTYFECLEHLASQRPHGARKT
jgi:hypothetical protein